MNANKKRERKGFKTFALAWVLTSLIAILFSSPAMAQLYDWTKLDPTIVPPGRDDHMMAFDSHKGLVYMFGGDKGSNATWVFDGKDWRDLGLTEVPAPRREAAMVYDSKRRMIVMYGGWDYTMDSNLTWQFDGTKWFGRAEEADPVGRSDHAMAFDEERGVTVMYGGQDVTAETWTFDGEEWKVVAAADKGPGIRWGHSMAYDSNRKVVVMFGGFTDQHMNDTWEWDGSTWTKIETAQQPAISRDHAMVFDSARNVMVLFGGRGISSVGLNDTWEYDGSNWVQRGPTESSPSVRHEVAAAFDSWRNKVVLFGGSTGDLPDHRYMDETWWYPNVPPMIQHTPEYAVSPESDLQISAEIEDVDNDIVDIDLFYRLAGAADYTMVPMEIAENVATAIIPASALEEASTLQYYIRAGDPLGSGKVVLSASSSKPYEVLLTKYGTLQVRMGTKVARKRGARWATTLTTDTWHKSGSTLDLKPGTYQIKFSIVDGFKKPGIETVVIERGVLTEITADYKNKKK